MVDFEKLLRRENVSIPEVNRVILQKGADLPLAEVLRIENKNDLLNNGYLKGENGFYHFSDGSAYAAVLTAMPDVSIEMIDWWFWWHAKEAIRYQIWYPDMHFDLHSDFKGCYDDRNMSFREKLHQSTHYVKEDIGTGSEQIAIDFMSPSDFGFDKKRVEDDQDLTIICARVGDMSKRVWHTRMCHQVRKTEIGVEMRSRFWMAQYIERMDQFAATLLNSLLNSAFVKRKLLPENLGKYMFHHCTQEYNNLAQLLPELFSSER